MLFVFLVSCCFDDGENLNSMSEKTNKQNLNIVVRFC
jgi:hypothetical protein